MDCCCSLFKPTVVLVKWKGTTLREAFTVYFRTSAAFINRYGAGGTAMKWRKFMFGQLCSKTHDMLRCGGCNAGQQCLRLRMSQKRERLTKQNNVAVFEL